MIRLISVLSAMALLMACNSRPAEEDPLSDLGAFRLGHNVVIASKAQKGPVSRGATAEEWSNALKLAVARRFGRYQGNQLYHFGISVEGYLLAPPGVPLVYKPKSALIINVTVWDDAAGKKLNEKVEQMTIFETTTGQTFLVGSGHARSKEQQIALLSANAMRKIEAWMVEKKKEEGWFEPREGAATSATVERNELVSATE